MDLQSIFFYSFVLLLVKGSRKSLRQKQFLLDFFNDTSSCVRLLFVAAGRSSKGRADSKQEPLQERCQPGSGGQRQYYFNSPPRSEEEYAQREVVFCVTFIFRLVRIVSYYLTTHANLCQLASLAQALKTYKTASNNTSVKK